jgi:hypothetical protein
MKDAMDLYPRDTELVRLLFTFALGPARAQAGAYGFASSTRPIPAGAADLVALALRRLPVLLDDDPELAYLAVPFMRDTAEASRYTAAYRASGGRTAGQPSNAAAPGARSEWRPNPGSIPAALMLGLISDEQAVSELFASIRVADQAQSPAGASELRPGVPEMDKALMLAVFNLLRGDPAREQMRRNLLSYSGVIKEDGDADGVFEIHVLYANGLLAEYLYDDDQDGLAEWDIRFNAGVPVEALVVLRAEAPYPARDLRGDAEAGVYLLPVKEEERALIRWEKYPSVLVSDFRGVRYIPRPMDFFFRPLSFPELIRDFLYPVREELDTLITERSLFSFSVALEYPSLEFQGAVERTEFQGGLARGAKTYLEGRVIAETEFSPLGRPMVERVDLDLDGRMETIRQYSRQEYGLVISSESDWDGDGIYEYAEILEGGGRTRLYWDLDRDGRRETEAWKETE